MKKIVIGFLVIVIIAFGYMYKNSKDKSERIAEEQEKQAIIANKHKKAILDSDIKKTPRKVFYGLC